MSICATRISTAPVASAGLTVAAVRATTSPETLTTSSGLSEPAAVWTSPASGWKTSCSRPERSRRSMKTTPPWSRRRCTHPATRTVSPTASAAATQVCVR